MRNYANQFKPFKQTYSHNITGRTQGNLEHGRKAKTPLNHQSAIGNQAVQSMHRNNAVEPNSDMSSLNSAFVELNISRLPLGPPVKGRIQTKLAMSAPGDAYEREADHIAKQIMRMPERQHQHTCSCAGSCPKCQSKKSNALQRHLQPKRFQRSEPAKVDIPSSIHKTLQSTGQPLPASTRAFMEPRFGHNFSQVRVHTDTQAADSAGTINARAYTVGRDVVFGRGQYAPNTHSGRNLLAHELTHVVQQNASTQSGRNTLPIGEPGNSAEYKAIKPALHNSTAQTDCITTSSRQLQRQFFSPPPQAGGFSGVMERDRRWAYSSDESQRRYQRRNITVVDWGENWNVFNFAAGVFHIGEIDASSVEDMVTQIQNDLGERDCINSLTIIGHGSPGSISVGDGTGSVEGGYIGGGTLDSASPAYNPDMVAILSRLTPLFCEDAQAVLRGCNVGNGLIGEMFVQRLADLWGIKVRAHIGTIRAGGEWTTGEWTEAEPS